MADYEEDVPFSPVPTWRLNAFNANSNAADAGGYPTSPGQVPDIETMPTSSGQVRAMGAMPQSSGKVRGIAAVPAAAATAAMPVGGLGALSLDRFEKQLALEAQRRDAIRQAEMAAMDQRMAQYGQRGMSDLDRASMLFQAAGAFLSPTKTGSFGESLGAAGTAVAGPLSKAAQAEREREDKLMQLQLARSKMAAEMGTGGISSDDMLKLFQMQRQMTPQPSEKERLYQRWQAEENPQRKKALGNMLGIETEDSSATSMSIPAEVRAAGSEAVKKYKEAYGTKVATEMASAQTAADNMAATIPILDRAEKAYKALESGGGIGPIVSSNIGRTISAVVKTQNEVNRQRYEQAAKELELLQARIKMKDQGAITEGERRILAMTLPRLDAVDPKVGIETLFEFRNQLKSVIEKPERIRTRGQEEKAPSGRVVDFGSLK